MSIKRSGLTFICFLGLGGLVLLAEDRYVVEPGTIADGNGGVYTSWDIAATQIQWAVEAATNAGDTVWVSNGVYVLTNQIVVVSNIFLRSTNGPAVTIVNGGFMAGAPDATTNNRCLFLSNSSAFVSGFTFTNGAVFANAAYVAGGGVHIGRGFMSNCIVRNNTVFTLDNSLSYIGAGGVYMGPGCTVMVCRVTDNVVTSAVSSSSGYGRGGGIIARGDGIIGCEIVGCVISNNILYARSNVGYGGGAYLYYTTIRSSMICNNDGKGGYGGVYLLGGLMDSCTSTLNQVKRGGGCRIEHGTVTNCVISRNSSSASGGGIYMGGSYGYVCNVFNTTITGNTNNGVNMVSGGSLNNMANCDIIGNLTNGVVFSGSNNCMSNCVIRENIGGIVCSNTSSTNSGVIRNCLIVNNTNYGNVGGLLIGDMCGTVLVSSCTIVSNQSPVPGAGIRLEATNAARISVSSCIIYSNGLNGTNDVFDVCAPTNYNALQYSCVGANPGFTGAVIIVDDPQFANFAAGNYRLSANSSCLNSGSNETWMTNACDLDKVQRIRYGSVDMGAYETTLSGTIYNFQ